LKAASLIAVLLCLAASPAAMSECRVLVWFVGATGWTDWDAPRAIYLFCPKTTGAYPGLGFQCRTILESVLASF